MRLHTTKCPRRQLSRPATTLVSAATGAGMIAGIAVRNHLLTPKDKREPLLAAVLNCDELPFLGSLVGFNVLCSQPGKLGMILACSLSSGTLLLNGDYPEPGLNGLNAKLDYVRKADRRDIRDLVFWGSVFGFCLWATNRLVAKTITRAIM